MGGEMIRLKKIWIFICILFLALTLRFAYIQLIGHEELASATRAQSLISLEGCNTRGMIYDRYGKAIVADSKRYVYIIEEDEFDTRTRKHLSEINAYRISGDNEGYYVYSSLHYDKKIGKKLIRESDAYILQAAPRYGSDQMAEHLIGYVNQEDMTGAAGLELMYDDRLCGLNREVYAAADVNGNILSGRGLIITSDSDTDVYFKEGIRTTLDKELQEEVEAVIEEYESSCAVVVLDTATGGVAAMACTPGFDPNNVAHHALGDGDELMNKVTQGTYPPGSVFKTVVAAAALEKGVEPEKTYTCRGHVSLNEIDIRCETGGEEGHGQIGLYDAFAQSCNSYFVQLGKEIGAQEIIDMAADMGYGNHILERFPYESSGHMMTETECAGDGIGNLSIGQGETLATPLQVAAMTNIIACCGEDKGVHLLMDDNNENEKTISYDTAERIRKMMGLVVTEGTASSLMLYDAGENPKAAAKTGTAEFMNGSDMQTHSWITGFAPFEEPEYTITVLVEGGSENAETAGPIFKRIIEYLEKSGTYSMPTLA